MQADRQDRVSSGDRGGHSTQTLIMIAIAVILAAAAWLIGTGGDDDGPAPAPPTQEAPAPALPSPPQPQPGAAVTAAPDIPAQEEDAPPPAAQITPATTDDGAAQEAVTPVEEAPAAPPEAAAGPSIEEVDADMRAALADAGAGGALASALDTPFLADRGVSAVDQLARGYVPLRALNLPRPQGRFPVRRDGLQHFVDPVGYRRYDRLVGAITALSPDRLAAAFRRFRPVLEKSYASLGYPAGAMDNAVIAALDAVLETPQLEGPVALRSKGALWAYADPALEGRSDLQKQLLRVGPRNLTALQSWAAELRRALLQ